MSGPDVMHYAISGANGAIAGTVAVNPTFTTVIGTGTSFLSGLNIGDTIVVNGEEHTILTISNNTTLHTVLPWNQTASGVTATVYSLSPTLFDFAGIPWPKGLYSPFSQPIDLGDGGLRGGGWPLAEWQWKFLTRPHRQSLRGYLPITYPSIGTASGQVRFRTSVNEQNDVFVTFLGQMIWPYPEQRDAQRRVPFVVKFRALVDLS